MKTRNRLTPVLAACAALAAGCAGMSDQEAAQKAQQVMKASFQERGQARLDRLDQDDTQKLCSKPAAQALAKETAERLEKANLATIRYPADGKLLGDWRSGEKIAQNGRGKQYSDNPKQPNGANCYACHQLSRAEISYATIGPSLHNFGKLRGSSEAIQRYTYGKIYNAKAYNLCSVMPRLGRSGTLTEQQIKDLTAYLLDPASPVNQ